jgi:hypothetical protein
MAPTLPDVPPSMLFKEADDGTNGHRRTSKWIEVGMKASASPPHGTQPWAVPSPSTSCDLASPHRWFWEFLSVAMIRVLIRAVHHALWAILKYLPKCMTEFNNRTPVFRAIKGGGCGPRVGVQWIEADGTLRATANAEPPSVVRVQRCPIHRRPPLEAPRGPFFINDCVVLQIWRMRLWACPRGWYGQGTRGASLS